MILLTCLDSRNGMLFNGRRQSRDRAVTARILQLTEGADLYMTAYSAPLFPKKVPQLHITEAIPPAGKGSFYFVETPFLLPPEEQLESIYIFRWKDRLYPADVHFPSAFMTAPWHLQSRRDFSGFSHEAITEELYIR